MLDGKKTTIGAVAMLIMYVLRQAGVEATEAQVIGGLAALWTVIGLAHKLVKAIVRLMDDTLDGGNTPEAPA